MKVVNNLPVARMIVKNESSHFIVKKIDQKQLSTINLLLWKENISSCDILWECVCCGNLQPLHYNQPSGYRLTIYRFVVIV